MMCEISRLYALNFNGGLVTWKRKKETTKCDRGELVKNPSTTKSDFSLELKYNEWMNSNVYLSLAKLGPS